MLAGMSVGITSLQIVLANLQTSTFTFHLTGSRYFGTNSEYSDYDFFVQDDHLSEYDVSGVRYSLVDKGFNLDFSHDCDYNEDISIVYVYKHPYGIHIQIVKDFEIKKKAQSSLFVNGASIHLRDKSLAKVLWKTALMYAQVSKPVKPATESYLFPGDALETIKYVYPISGKQIFGTLSNGYLKDNKIAAIGLYRRLTGLGLIDSKEAIDSLLK